MATKEAPATATEAGGFDLSREGGEGWKPADGDVLVGTIQSIAARWSDWGNGGRGAFYPVQTISAEEGSTQNGKPIRPGTLVAFHAFHTIPFKRIMQLRPLEGEKVGIKFHGEVDNADGKTKSKLYTYKVAREKGSGPDPYGGLTPPGGKDAKAELKAAKGADVSDEELNQILS